MDVDAERRIAELERQLAEKDRQLADKDRQIGELSARVAELEKKLESLMLELGRTSSNSSRPPSSDSPSERAKRAQKGSKQGERRRGGQPNHRGHRRELVPAGEVDDVVHFFPSHCEHCSAPLQAAENPNPIRFQLTELPAFEPHVTEYQRHTVKCQTVRSSTTIL